MGLVRWLPVALLLIIMAVPDASAVTQTRRDIDALKRQVYDLEGSMANVKASIAKLPTEDSIALMRETQAKQLTQLAELLSQVQVLTGRFEESKYYMDRLLRDTKTSMDMLQSRMDSLGKSLGKDEIDTLTARLKELDSAMTSVKMQVATLEKSLITLTEKQALAEPEPKAEPDQKPEPKPEPTAKDEYQAALKVYKAGELGRARGLMNEFIKKYPDDKLAGNAQFWVAETYYAASDFDDAILAYEDLLQKYKKHSKVPDALFKQALAFLKLKDEKAARGILLEITGKYPSSPQAKTAKEKLDSMGVTPAPKGQ